MEWHTSDFETRLEDGLQLLTQRQEEFGVNLCRAGRETIQRRADFVAHLVPDPLQCSQNVLEVRQDVGGDLRDMHPHLPQILKPNPPNCLHDAPCGKGYLSLKRLVPSAEDLPKQGHNPVYGPWCQYCGLRHENPRIHMASDSQVLRKVVLRLAGPLAPERASVAFEDGVKGYPVHQSRRLLVLW